MVARKPRMGNGRFAEQVDAAVSVAPYGPAIFAGGAVGAVGLLLPPLHPVNDPITVAIASHFFIVPPGSVQLEGRTGLILRVSEGSIREGPLTDPDGQRQRAPTGPPDARRR